jgi:hypothetical protein
MGSSWKNSPWDEDGTIWEKEMKFHVNGGGYENAWFSGNGFRPLQKNGKKRRD